MTRVGSIDLVGSARQLPEMPVSCPVGRATLSIAAEFLAGVLDENILGGDQAGCRGHGP